MNSFVFGVRSCVITLSDEDDNLFSELTLLRLPLRPSVCLCSGRWVVACDGTSCYNNDVSYIRGRSPGNDRIALEDEVGHEIIYCRKTTLFNIMFGLARH